MQRWYASLGDLTEIEAEGLRIIEIEPVLQDGPMGKHLAVIVKLGMWR
jgi:hypothetical protein